jgi:hypothetical protein
MDYSGRIKFLESSVAAMDKEMLECKDEIRVKHLENKKSEYSAEIRRLYKLQWEESTQRVEFDDDR